MTHSMSRAGQTSVVRHLGVGLLVAGPSWALEACGIAGKERFYYEASRGSVQCCLEFPLPAEDDGHAAVRKCQTGF